MICNPYKARGRAMPQSLMVLAAGAVLLLSSNAVAQESSGFGLDRVHPATRQIHNHVSVLAADVPDTFTWEVSALATLAWDPLAVNFNVGDDAASDIPDRVEYVSFQGIAHVLANFAFAGRVELGLDIPVIFAQSSDAESGAPDLPNDEPPEDGGIGDPRIATKVNLFDSSSLDTTGFALGLAGDVRLPLGDEDLFQGDGGLSGSVALLGTLRTASQMRLSLNVGADFRPANQFLNLTTDDALIWGLAFLAPVGDIVEVGAEIRGAHVLGAEDSNAEENPIEAMLHGRAVLPMGLHAGLGVGTGLIEGAGAPDVRAFLAIGYSGSATDDDGAEPRPARERQRRERERARDRQDPGGGTTDEAPDAPAAAETCTTGPEDIDGFEDDDNCADPDNDNDGIPDVDDECPMVRARGTQDGCPFDDSSTIDYEAPEQAPTGPSDIDGDGVIDLDDQCPEEPEDIDGYRDQDGCPEDDDSSSANDDNADPDNDGLPNIIDFCPDEAEDFDGVFDDDGCPEDDGDLDGVPDEEDRCPMIPGDAANQGCISG